MGQHQLQNHFANFIHLLGSGSDDQVFFHRVKAGGNEILSAAGLHFHRANPAGAVRLQFLVVTEGGNGDPCPSVLPPEWSSLPLPLLLFRRSVRGFRSFFFALSDYGSCFFRDRRRNRLAGNLLHRAEAGRADFKAGSALRAFLLVNDMDLVLAAFNRLGRAFLEATHTGLALVRIDIVRDQLLAGIGRAPLLLDVRLILIPEVAYRAQNRVRSALAQGAKGGVAG